jgi:Reverse transcriptase (RNA-dependent DNA polymerase)/RNase H-like domain found in reverse transcriptase
MLNQDINFVMNQSQKNISNSAYVRIKIFKKPIVAKMLIDSGNLVSDLISEEFAKSQRVKSKPIQKTVGTAAKGGSVEIIGQSEPIKIFLENVPRPVIIKPYIVRNLSHPINVGRDFLGRYKGKLEYSPTAGFLEIQGAKTKLILKKDPLESDLVTDSRLRKVFAGAKLTQGEMIYQGSLNAMENKVNQDRFAVETKELNEIPGHSAKFVKMTTNGQLPLRIARGKTLVLEVEENDALPVVIMPGLYKLIENEAYCLVVNPEMERKKNEKGMKIGEILLMEDDEEDEINAVTPPSQSKEDLKGMEEYIKKELKLDENEILKSDPTLRNDIIKLFMEYQDAISQHEFDYGHTAAIQCQIQLKPGEEEPVRLKARPLNPAQEASMKKQIEEWERSNIIEKTQSPWAFPMVGVKKKDSDSLRWCVDYRLLNRKTVKDAYPLSSIENNLHKLQGAKYFTTLDSAGAYHELEIHPESREYTAFITPFGQYQFARMPFGLSNAGACYSRLVALALQYLPGDFALAYLDDIILFSKSVEDHLYQLRQVLDLHRQFGMKLKLSKCKVLQEQVEYLGHLVSEDGIRMIPGYVDKILSWPLPQTGKQLKPFLGFIGYYRGFIPDVAELTYEMNEMKKGAKLTWPIEVVEKFEKLKKRFAEAPLRSYPQYDSEEPFILDTDFSKTNLAAILSQKQDGEEKFIGAGARKCNRAEQNYPSHKGELAAVVMGLRKFEHILRFKPFVLRTDSRCMQFLDSLKEVRGIYARWLNFVQGFDFRVEHRRVKRTKMLTDYPE